MNDYKLVFAAIVVILFATVTLTMFVSLEGGARIEEVTNVKELKDATRVTVKINKMVPNVSSLVIFSDNKFVQMAEYNDGDQRRFETDHLVLYFDFKDAPLRIKSADDLKRRLPLFVKVQKNR